MSPLRRVLLAGGGLLLLAAFYVGAAGTGESERWAKVEKRELVFGIPFEGQLFALENLELGPPGDIDDEIWQFNLAFLATEGKEVAAGEPVLRFDPSELIKRLERATAELDEATKTREKRAIEIEIQRRERRLQLAEAEAKARKSALELAVPEELLSRRELETSRIDQKLALVEIEFRKRSLAGLDRAEEIEMASLEERVTLAAGKVARLQKAIAALTVLAPKAGTVIVRIRNVDEKFKVGDPVWRADKVIQIPDLRTLRARVEIDEALAGRVQIGQRASFYLDSHPDRELRGRLEMITQTVQRRSATDASKILKATVTVEPGETAAPVALRPGMRLRGQIEEERRAEVLTIPQEAVFGDAGGVYVEVRGLLGNRRLRPTLGRRSGSFFEVLGGLEPGQEVRLGAAGGGA